MLSKKLIESLKKQKYGFAGNHSAVQICSWTKKSLVNEGECYKEKFYGITCHRCCEMAPSVGFCQNRCLHCWRAIELTEGDSMKNLELDSPKEIIENCIKARNKLMLGFKGNKKINMKKYLEAQEPNHFAISLTGEPTLYPLLGELISELRNSGKTTFLVTNGLNPEVLKNLDKNKQLPTQLYVSMNSYNKDSFLKWHRSSIKNSWERFNETLNLMPKLNTRKVIRMTLAKGKFSNMKKEFIKEYISLIKKASPDFIEVKGFMSVGFARNRDGMNYESMPTFEEVNNFAKLIAKELGNPYQVLDEQIPSRIVLIGKDKNKMKIKKEEI